MVVSADATDCSSGAPTWRSSRSCARTAVAVRRQPRHRLVVCVWGSRSQAESMHSREETLCPTPGSVPSASSSPATWSSTTAARASRPLPGQAVRLLPLRPRGPPRQRRRPLPPDRPVRRGPGPPRAVLRAPPGHHPVYSQCLTLPRGAATRFRPAPGWRGLAPGHHREHPLTKGQTMTDRPLISGTANPGRPGPRRDASEPRAGAAECRPQLDRGGRAVRGGRTTTREWNGLERARQARSPSPVALRHLWRSGKYRC